MTYKDKLSKNSGESRSVNKKVAIFNYFFFYFYRYRLNYLHDFDYKLVKKDFLFKMWIIIFLDSY